MVTADPWPAYLAANRAARWAYYHDQPPDQTERARAKAARKAAAQQRYRDRKKAQK